MHQRCGAFDVIWMRPIQSQQTLLDVFGVYGGRRTDAPNVSEFRVQTILSLVIVED